MSLPSSPPLYGKLNCEQKEIRLLSIYSVPESNDHSLIQYKLDTFGLENTPEFDALSYVWGDPNVTIEIQLCGISTPITKNLFAALTRLSERSDVKWIWVDAICINQVDVAEKNKQIPLMSRIFKSARRVISWLGDADGGTQIAISLIDRWATAILSTNPNLEDWPNSSALRAAVRTVEEPFDKAAWAAMNALWRRAYWERTWIVQEVSLARSCLVVCGRSEISFHKILWTCRAWMYGDLRVPGLLDAITTTIFCNGSFSTFIRIIMEINDRDLHKTPHTNLQNSASYNLSDFPFFLKRASCLSATNPRDKIYGLIGLTNVLNPPIPVDYGHDVAKVYTDVTCSVIKATGRLDILTFGGNHSHQDTPEGTWPSWVPDFRHNLANRFSDHTPFYDILYFNAAGETKADCDAMSDSKRLLVKGLLCGEIAEVASTHQDAEQRFIQWLLFTLRYQSILDRSQISAQQILFRIVIADQLWRGLKSPNFLARHLEAQFFRQAVVYMLAVRNIYEGKWPSYLSESHSSNDYIELDAQTWKALAEWFQHCMSQDASTLKSAQVRDFLGPPHSQCRLSWPDYVHIDVQEIEPESVASFRAALAQTASWSLFITSTGYMGLSSCNIKKGDKIFIPLGCSVPVAVRSREENFVLVCDTYVLGMMQGEMMGKLGNDQYNLTQIVLV